MPRGKATRSLEMVAAAREILAEIQPASVRAVCYRLFVRGLLRGMSKGEVARAGTQLLWAREAGRIPWAWIVDETRELERRPSWADPAEYAESVRRSYRRDRWLQQPRRVEVWSEKGTIRGVLASVLHTYGVGFRVLHGFSSGTTMHAVAEETQDDPQPLCVFYIGDWDPSGLHMSEVDIPGRLIRKYGGRAIFRRIALDAYDVERTGLPSFPASDKRSDSRYRWFAERFGDTCWELDAMNPNDLRQRVENAIRDEIEWDAWHRCELAERGEIESLHDVLGGWKAAAS